MSKSYLVPVPLTLLLSPDQLARRGRLELGFDLMNLLAPERMNELLAEVLRNAGWENDEGKWIRSIPGGGAWIIDPAARTLEIDLTGRLAQSISLTHYGEGRPATPTSLDEISAIARTTLQAALQGLEETEKEQVVREAVRARQALAEALKDVYREALQEKARSLGNVVSVDETSKDGTLRIRIEIT